MTPDQRQRLIDIILERESLRPLSRGSRLFKAPFRTLPYYLLATLGHLHPFPITFTTLWNTKMTCYLPEGNTFYYYGYCEANLTNFFLRFVEEGMTVIDVGAHVGIYSMLSAALVGGTGSVHSFEPTPRTFGILQKNTRTLKNIYAHNKAVAAVPGTLTFADYGAGYGAYNSASSAGAPDTGRTPQMITVPSTTLDDYCAREKLQPTMIKIDAEGFEYEVLKGAANLLKLSTSPRPFVTIEVAGGTAWQENRQMSFTLLGEAMYVPYQVNKNGTIAPHQLQDTYTYDNLLFVPKERLSEITHLT